MIGRETIENQAPGGETRDDVARGAKDDPARSPAVPAFAAPQGPAPRSLIGAAAGFATSMARFAASGFQRVDEQSQRLRVSHCEPCRYRKQNRCGSGSAADRGHACTLHYEVAVDWPTNRSKDVTLDEVEEMMKEAKARKNMKRWLELKPAKKILSEAKRVKGRGPGVRPPRGGGPARCVTPFDPLSLILDTLGTWLDAER